jgi:hypothetical protein
MADATTIGRVPLARRARRVSLVRLKGAKSIPPGAWTGPPSPAREDMASRLETLTKQLGRTVLLSRAFADFVESDFDLERVGEYPVRGFNDRIELFAYHG